MRTRHTFYRRMDTQLACAMPCSIRVESSFCCITNKTRLNIEIYSHTNPKTTRRSAHNTSADLQCFCVDFGQLRLMAAARRFERIIIIIINLKVQSNDHPTCILFDFIAFRHFYLVRRLKNGWGWLVPRARGRHIRTNGIQWMRSQCISSTPSNSLCLPIAAVFCSSASSNIVLALRAQHIQTQWQRSIKMPKWDEWRRFISCQCALRS